MSRDADDGAEPDADSSPGTGSPTVDGRGSDDEPATIERAGRTIAFHSCARATVTGTFEDGDVAYANTGFYDDGLYGDTILEDGVAFGDDVDAPFSGTVVFEIGEGSGVTVEPDRVVVGVPEYGSDGTVITSLTTRREDYRMGAPTHEHPRASECLGAIESGGGSDDRDGAEAALVIDSLETNAPVDSGQSLEVRVAVRNSGATTGARELRLVVGHTPECVDARSLTLDSGDSATVVLGYETPPVDDDREVPIRVEVGEKAASQSVLVYGTE